MRWTWRRAPATTAGCLLAITTLACSDGDPVQPNNGNVTLVASNSPAYSDQYQWVRIQIDQITVRPLDAQANSYLPIPLGLLQTPKQVDVRSTSPVTLEIVPLRAGSYRVESVRVSAMDLNLPNTAPQNAVGCSGTELVSARVAGATLLSYATPPILSVSSDGSSSVTVAIDGPGLVSMLTSQPYTCGVPPFPPPTSTQLAQFISLN